MNRGPASGLSASGSDFGACDSVLTGGVTGAGLGDAVVSGIGGIVIPELVTTGLLVVAGDIGLDASDADFVKLEICEET